MRFQKSNEAACLNSDSIYYGESLSGSRRSYGAAALKTEIPVTAGDLLIAVGSRRHPLYASAFLYLVGTPLALASCWGLLATLFMVPVLVWRHFDEENLLAAHLPRYSEYQEKVRHRLVPYIW